MRSSEDIWQGLEGGKGRRNLIIASHSQEI